MVSLKKVQTRDYEEQFELILKESTFINELNRTLEHFQAMPTFVSTAKELIKAISEKQLSMLTKLRKQIDDFNKQNQSSIIKSSEALEKGFDQYRKQQEKYRMELVSVFHQHFSDYLKETNPLSTDFHDPSKTLIPLKLAELGIEGSTKDQLNTVIQLLKAHVPLTMDFENSLEVIKKAHSIDPEISQFIFIAYEKALLLLEERINKHFSDQNLELVKTDYDDLHALFLKFYRENIITLVNYYQNYKNITEVFQKKFDILNDVGEPTQDWLDRYQQLSNSTAFFSKQITPQTLKSTCDQLSAFKKEIKLENSKEFLQEIKNKIQLFLDDNIQRLNQEFEEHRSNLIELTNSFVSTQYEITKILENKQSQFLAIQKKWTARKERLQLINNLKDLKNFKQHFPQEKLFSHSLDLENIALHNAFTIFDGSISIDEKNRLLLALSTISESDLIVKSIILILESIDTQQLPKAIKNLLQFIYSENTHPTVNDFKKPLANALKNFFNTQSEKTAFCLEKTIDNASFILKDEIHGNLLNYLRLIEVAELQKIKQKNSTAINNEFAEDNVADTIEKLILTKETLNLFEASHAPTTVWDACLFFKKFYSSSLRFQSTTYPFLNKTNNIAFIKAVESLSSLLRMLTRTKGSISFSSLFLKPNKQKQELIENLIKNLKETPITQADKNYIKDFFEKWRHENEHIIKEPRYRLLVGVFMLIYRHIKKLFSHSDFETNSCKTVNELQHFFTSAYEDLEQIKVAFDPFSTKIKQDLSVESERSLIQSR